MINKVKNLIYKLLIKSQKYTGTDVVYLAKFGSYLTIGNLISLIASFLLSIALARLLPKEVYGDYRYILSIFELLAISSLQGMNGAIVQGVARGFDKLAKDGLKTKLRWSLLGSFASIIIGAYFWLKGNTDFTISFLIVAAFLPLIKSSEIYQSLLDGKKLFNKRVKYSIIIQIFYTLIFLLVLFITKNLIIIILAYFFSITLIRTYFLVKTFKKFIRNNSSDPEIIKYGKNVSFVGIIGLIAQQIDKILLFHFVGPVKLAIYSFATLPIDQLRSPLQSIQEIALPKLATRPIEEIKKTLPKKLLKASLLIILVIIIYILFVPYVYKIFFPQYLDAIFYSRLFSLDLLVFPISMMMLTLCAKMKTRELYRVSILNSVIEIVLMVVLAPFYGITGVILARLISHIFYFFLARFSFKKM
jgi:O-antigen/teichoic acid export membrane protein